MDKSFKGKPESPPSSFLLLSYKPALFLSVEFDIIIPFILCLRIISFIYGTQPWEFPYGLFGYFNNFLTISILCINLLMFKDVRLKINL